MSFLRLTFYQFTSLNKMNEWKITKEFIALSPRNQITAILVLLLLLLTSSSGLIVRYYECKITEMQSKHLIELSKKDLIINEKDKQFRVVVKQSSDFMEKQILIGYGFKNEIDSLKNLRK